MRTSDREQAGGLRLVIAALAASTGGGIASVTRLTQALARQPDVEHVWLVLSPDVSPEAELARSSNVTLMRPALGRRVRLARRALWELASLPRLAKHTDAAAVIVPAGVLPRMPGRPVIALPSNTLVFESPSLGNRLRRLAVIRTSRRAAAVIVPSAYMAELFGDAMPVSVVGEGLDPSVFRPAPRPGRDIVYVSDFYPHKRHDLALQAWQRLREPRPALHLVGAPVEGSPDFQEMADRLDALGDDRVKLHGRLGPEQVANAYRRARVALMPSEHESFSLPVAEAASCGTPTVARDLPVLRETGGRGAVYVAGDDPAAWARAIDDLLADDVRHRHLREEGIRHSAGFSWDERARAVLAAVAGTGQAS